MPHLIIRGVDPGTVRELSPSLVEELAAICGCPNDHVMLECLHTTSCFGGEFASSYPFVEVHWFERGGEVRDRAAECIDRHIRSNGVEEMEIAFRVYDREGYYANGKRLSSEEDGELRELREENRKLKEELRKARAALQSGAGSRMSSKLYDALRE
ncbi:DUF1904 family protein [Paenibacillaceae bacterium WGS1546]|uniref:DUF1904 family protein n=1 Tax=Cohnella sp. WGS1546 TaxID=3366810 RepID=UPI00372D15DE